MNQSLTISALVMGAIIAVSTGCSTAPRESATWLAASTNAIAAQASSFKAQRDALAESRAMSIHSLERYALELESDTATITSFWGMPDPAKSEQKALFDKVRAESDAAEKRQTEWDALRTEHEKRVASAKSSVASITESLGQTSKALVALGEKDDLAALVAFYGAFFADVKTSLDELQKQTEKKTKVAEEQTANKGKEAEDAISMTANP